MGTMLWNKTGTWRYLKPRYINKTPPCNEACPAGNDIEGFMVLTREGKFREAWELIKEENPFPGVCGRVCFHPCESSCNRREYDEALSIHGIERFLAANSEKGRHAVPVLVATLAIAILLGVYGNFLLGLPTGLLWIVFGISILAAVGAGRYLGLRLTGLLRFKFLRKTHVHK